MANLKKGDKHFAVRELQEALNRYGITPTKLAEDGDYGNWTKLAVRRFQETQPDLDCSYAGVAGPETQERLGIKFKVDQLVRKYPLPHNPTDSWAKDFRVERIMYSEYGPRDGGGVNGKEIMSYSGQGFLLAGFEGLIGGRIGVYKRSVYMFHGPNDPDRVEIEKNECAALVQAFGLPKAEHWRRGPRVKNLPSLKRGTVVATLRDDKYHNDKSGRSHVGIFLSQNKAGITILDQYNGANIQMRTKEFKPDDMGEERKVRKRNERPFGWTADGDEYFVLYSTKKCGGRDYDA